MNNFAKFALRGAVTAAATLLVGSTAMFAGTIPYSPTGVIASTTNLLATGSTVTAYYGGSSAADTDYIDIIDVTSGASTGYIFDNQMTAEGTSATLATSVGDTIIVDVKNMTGEPYDPTVFSSKPSNSADGVNHAYITPITSSRFDFFSDGTTFLNFSPSLISTIVAANPYFVGVEDRYYPTLDGVSTDLDYNDDTLVLTGVTPTPEPSSLMLMGTGLLGAAGLLFRRRQTV